MRVLYALSNYPKLSESYVAAEIRYVQTQGVEVQVWSPAVGTQGAPELVPVHRGELEDAITSFKPHLVHAHYALDHWTWMLKSAADWKIPVTVRGHSFEFDIAKVNALEACDMVRRIWLFPHFAGYFAGSRKVRPLPVAFDSTRYFHVGGFVKEKNLVVRAAAGKPNKGLRDFIDIARLCPAHQFKLVVDRVDNEFDEYVGYLEHRAAGSGVEILKSIPDRAVVDLVQRAGIYLDTADPDGHPFGMPISIAEAMATGSLVIAREMPWLEHIYIGHAGVQYKNSEIAAEIIKTSTCYSSSDWATIAERAVTRSIRFRDTSVLPALVEDWRQITGK